MLKFILSNNAEIEVLDGSTLFDLRIVADKYAAMWEILTERNLKVVKLVSENGDLIDQLSDLTVDHEFSIKEKDVIYCHFYLREKNVTEIELELLRNQVAELTAELSVHDGAINDLGEAVSGLAEEGGLA